MMCEFYKDGRCIALTDGAKKSCKNGIPFKPCAFYKTPEQAAESREKANERLRKLPEDRQKFIAEYYYSGVRVWDK